VFLSYPFLQLPPIELYVYSSNGIKNGFFKIETVDEEMVYVSFIEDNDTFSVEANGSLYIYHKKASYTALPYHKTIITYKHSSVEYYHLMNCGNFVFNLETNTDSNIHNPFYEIELNLENGDNVSLSIF
jgi:hypothetical protein